MYWITHAAALWLVFSAAAYSAEPAKSIPFSEFSKRADQLLRSQTGTQWGQHSFSIASESKTLYSWEADKKAKPASNLKLLTTILSFELLGEDYPFQTGIAFEDTGERFRVYLRGQGDPSLSDSFLTPNGRKNYSNEFLDLLTQKISQKIQNPAKPIELILDDSSFSGTPLGPWPNQYLVKCYSAGVGAFNFGLNCDDVTLHPPATAGKSPSFSERWAPDYFEIKDETNWKKKGRRPSWEGELLSASTFEAVSIQREMDGQISSVLPLWSELVNLSRPAADSKEIVFSGDGLPVGGKPALFRVSVSSMTEYFAKLLKARLEQKGFTVARWQPAAFPAQAGAESISLTDLKSNVYMMNKLSVNHIAESLFRAFSLKQSGHSTYDASREIAKNKLAEKLEISDQDFYYADGSGLSHDNRVTSQLLVKALQFALQRPWWATLEESLPIGGVDGSLGGRMQSGCYLQGRYYSDPKACGLKGNVRAKTGYIGKVITLTGTMKNFQGKRILFSLLTNDFQDLYSNRNHIRSFIHEQVLAELYRTEL